MFSKSTHQEGAPNLGKIVTPTAEPTHSHELSALKRSAVDIDAVRSGKVSTSSTHTANSFSPTSRTITQTGDLHGLVGSGRLEVDALPRSLASISLSDGRDLARSVETGTLRTGVYTDKVVLHWTDGTKTGFSKFKITVSD